MADVEKKPVYIRPSALQVGRFLLPTPIAPVSAPRRAAPKLQQVLEGAESAYSFAALL
jgi:hypothetical protein